MQREVEVLWSQEKYRVMYFSQQHYNEIRKVMKSGAEIHRVKELIEEAISLKPTTGSILNAYQHMWGYFKKYASLEEKQASASKSAAFSNGQLEPSELLVFIRELALKYEVDYLLQSTILELNEKENGPLP